MASLRNGMLRNFSRIYHYRLVLFSGERNAVAQSSRKCCDQADQLTNLSDNNPNDYKFDITNDPADWKFVDRLLPIRTVPIPETKPVYPSGWRPPQLDNPLDAPYCIERSRNHMLSVYFRKVPNKNIRITTIKRIRGDIWQFHSDLMEYLKEATGKIAIASCVYEASCVIHIRGDYVYYVEQWMLSKGF